MLIGRDKERHMLQNAYKSDYSQFVAIYGRRRVGKTFLVRETFKYKFTFEHTGMANTKTREQLRNFQSSLKKAGYTKAAYPHNWIEAFELLEDFLAQSQDKKKTVFIDELPWMDAPKSGFLNAFEHFWNGWASARKDILLIVCGSATSWIINHIVNNYGGLHNRLTCEIALQPFTLKECLQLVKSMHIDFNTHQLLECYMIMGGIPYYWSRLQKGMSLAQNIDELFFCENGGLKNEYNSLYRSLFNSPEIYLKVIETLGKKRMGMTRKEIVQESGVSNNGTLSKVLSDLEYCSFIKKYNAWGGKTNNALFQLMDFYTLFYFKFIENNVNNDHHFWSNSIDSPMHRAWSGLAFENVCLMHVPQIKQALGISGITSIEYTWKSKNKKQLTGENAKGVQIDLLIDRNDQVINLCEIKFNKEKFVVDEECYMNLMHKKNVFLQETKTRKSVHLTMITVYGIRPNSYANDIQNEISATDLLK